ncbi:MAG: thioredoxin family protein [Lachnospiraceae bacterium]|nr:thioredoxin family protein [Lachnospiraceae bacterium]
MNKVIIFKAGWCGPCKAYAPAIDAAEDTLAELGIEIERIDVDTHPDTAMKYGVRGIPYTVVESNDSIKTTWSGSKSEFDLIKEVKTALGL